MHFLSWTISRRQVLGDHRGGAGLNPFLLIKTRSASAIVVRAAMEANAHLGDKGAAGEALKARGEEDHAGSAAAEEEEAREKTRASVHRDR